MRIYKIGVLFSLVASIYLLANSVQVHSLPDFISIVNDNRPSVVRIEVDRDSLEEDESAGSLGSGFFMSNDGYIITNNHVIAEAVSITVKTWDRISYDAVLVGTDELTDVAVLKIDGLEHRPVVMGSTYHLVVGQWVLAIGSPYGHDYTATAGIISTVKRYTPDLYVPFLQSDVAINPGNSGGPLFDGDGKVIGINSQIYSRTGSSAGISYSIPIDLALVIVKQLKENGYYERGLLGAVTEGTLMDHGALITEVRDESSADRGGLHAGDIIVEFDGKVVDRASALPPIVGLAPVGVPVSVTVLREGIRVGLFVFLDKFAP